MKLIIIAGLIVRFSAALAQANPQSKDAGTPTTAKYIDAYDAAETQLTAENRATMILPPQPDFKPSVNARSVQLRLSMASTNLKINDPIRFRLEMINIGNEPIDYKETHPSIFKFGRPIDSRTIHLVLTYPNGKRVPITTLTSRKRWRELLSKAPPFAIAHATVTAIPSDSWLIDTNARGAANNVFKVRILPGETLRSRGDGDTTGNVYRTLMAEQDLSVPGKYTLQAVLDDRPTSTTKTAIESAKGYQTAEQTIAQRKIRQLNALGPIESNVVSFEVSP